MVIVIDGDFGKGLDPRLGRGRLLVEKTDEYCSFRMSAFLPFESEMRTPSFFTVSLISETPRIAANRHESPHRHESPRIAVFAQHSSFFHASVILRMVRVCEVPNFRSTFQS